MAAINWSEKYSVGIVSIDNQHKKLFDLINKLSDSMKAGKSSEQLGTVFLELINYTDMHFKAEEAFFKQYSYPSSIKHVMHHDDLRKQVMALKEKHAGGSSVITVQLLTFLVDWVNNHILQEDKAYSSYLISKGVH